MNLEPHKKEEISKSQIEIVDKMRREFKHIGSIKHNPGHILFSFNMATMEIKQAVISKESILGLNGNISFKKKVIIEPDCIYREALNKKNFIKKLLREGIISIKPIDK